MPFTIISHTADTGFIVEDNSPEGVVNESIAALFTIILGENFAKRDIYDENYKPRLKTIERGACDLSIALHDLLEELLFLFGHEGLVPVEVVSISVKDNYRLKVKLKLRPIDWGKAKDLTEVKAITYHNLSFERKAKLWQAKVIVDL